MPPAAAGGRGRDMELQRGRVVVGVDGSRGSRAALAFALHDAARRGASVHVVAAFAPPEYWVPLYGPPAVSLDDVREGVRRDGENIVREVTEELRGENLPQMPEVTVTAVPGGAARALLDAARHADLLVVGSRGHGGFSSMLLGSVSLSCALHARCPVTVVHGAEQAAEQEEAEETPAAREAEPAVG
jgi:nucleotide-binding universal stress UspA family protein